MSNGQIGNGEKAEEKRKRMPDGCLSGVPHSNPSNREFLLPHEIVKTIVIIDFLNLNLFKLLQTKEFKVQKKKEKNGQING